MPLIQPTDSINHGLVQDMRIAVAAAATIVRSLNQMGERLTRLPDDTLADWLNSLPRGELDALFLAHFETAHMINACVERMLTAAGESAVTMEAPRADARPLTTRLNAAGREAVVDTTGRWVVRATTSDGEPTPAGPPTQPEDQLPWPPPSLPLD